MWQVVAGCLTGEHGKAHVNIFNDDENIQSELAAAQRNMLQFTLLFECGGGAEAEPALKPKHGRVFCGGTSAASSSAEVCAVSPTYQLYYMRVLWVHAVSESSQIGPI